MTQPNQDKLHDFPALDDDGKIEIDVERLVETRLLVTANSGAGKTWLLRRLLEQTYGKVQHIIIDPEGEMHTLREKFDYILAAPKGGDCVADLRSAALLARRLLELGVSAVVDIYDLGTYRPAFVKLFLESLMNAPRDAWAPVLVVIEECHKLCPEKGEGEAASSEAIKDLFTRGRKRGYAGVASTQRLSVLHKSVAAECNNRLIGRTVLDLDMARAGKALGFRTREHLDQLVDLDDGQFFAQGPALTRQVTLFKSGSVQTTHERAGQRRKSTPTPPRERVRQILAQLADLPHQAEEEAQTVEQLRKRVNELEAREVAIATTPVLGMGGFVTTTHAMKLAEVVAQRDRLLSDNADMRKALADEKAWVSAGDNILKVIMPELDRLVSRATEVRGDIQGRIDEVVMLQKRDTADFEALIAKSSIGDGLANIRQNGVDAETARLLQKQSAPHDVTRKRRQPATDGEALVGPTVPQGTGVAMSAMERANLISVAMGARSKAEIRIITGYAASGPLGKAWGRLSREGWWEEEDGLLWVTQAGLDALGTWESLAIGGQLRGRLLRDNGGLSVMERSILDACCQVYPNGISRNQVRIRTGYAASGPLGKAYATLLTSGYIDQNGLGILTASPLLFDVGEEGKRRISPDELRASIITKLPAMESGLLRVICGAYPQTISRTAAREAAGYAPSGPIGAAFSALITALYIDKSGVRDVVASKELFE